MRQIEINVATFDGVIELGKQGENLATRVIFDYTDWLKEVDEQVEDSHFSLVFQRPRDNVATLDPTITVENGKIMWNIIEQRLQNEGLGYIEIRFNNGKTFKSRTVLGVIRKGLSISYEPSQDNPIPEPPTEAGIYNLMYYVSTYNTGYAFIKEKLELEIDTGDEPVQPETVYAVTGATYEEFENAILSGIPISLEFLFVDYEKYVVEMTAYRKSNPADAFSSGLTFLGGNFVSYFIHVYRDSEDETKLSAMLYLP